VSEPQVTILIPNYKTPELTKICCRLIRKYTPQSLYRVIAIDNASGEGEESLEYLRSLSWITLLERDISDDPRPGLSHSRALDLAVSQTATPYVLSIHTDTFTHHPEWLQYLIQEIEKSDQIGGVGSWKLEYKPFFKRLAKKIEYAFQSTIYPLIGKGEGHLAGKGKNYYYLRSHCALYRTDLIKQYGLSFAEGADTAGKVLHKRLEDNGHKMVFLPSESLVKYVYHANHATMVLNPELGSGKKSVSSGTKRIQKVLDNVNYKAILADDSLDQ
jgi:GT2 family glycosyltransferase